MLATSGVTPLLMIVGGMTAQPRAGGGSKNCVQWNIENALCDRG